jgi:outer membrane protein OmpA-like peptidoglycan-associated protein
MPSSAPGCIKQGDRNVDAMALFSSGLVQGARARWGTAVGCEPAAATQRYCGPVFVKDEYLVQRVAPGRAIVHRLAAVDCTTSRRLQKRAEMRRLNDLTLSIYYIDGRGVAYLRACESAAHRHMVVPERSRNPGPLAGGHVSRASPIALAVAASFALAACASHKLVTPNGRERVAVNTPDSLKNYQDLVVRQDAITLEKSQLRRQVDELNQEVATLKSYVLQQQRTKGNQSRPDGAVQPQSDSQGPSPPSQPARPLPPGSSRAGTVNVSSDRVVFRVSHEVGHTEFQPTAELELELLKAAKAAKVVVIRGRTDSETVDDVETRIALGRAVHARQYLVSNGVETDKIRLWYRAAGDFIADNSTVEGRAVNRRVEIEVRGLDTSAFASVASDVRVGRNQ